MGSRNFKIVFLWYLIPFVYLWLIEGVFLSNTALILGTFLFSLSLAYRSFSKVAVQKPFKLNNLSNTFFEWVSFLVAIVQLYGFYRVAVDGLDLASHRMEFFGEQGGIFKSTYLYTLYSVFLMPLLLISVMFWINGDLGKKANKRKIIFALVLIALDGLLALGRFQYLYIFFFLFVSYKSFGFKKVFLFSSTILVIAISFLIIYFRQFFVDAAVDSATDIINADVVRTSIISYQYDGYVFLDKLAEGKSFFGHPWELNTLSFGFLFTKIISTKVGLSFAYPWEDYNLVLTEGMYHSKLDIFFNAFSTNFFPIYLDLGYIGIIFYGILSGAFLAFKTNNQLLKAVQYLNLFILIFGLYQPILTTLIGFILQIAYLGGILYFLKHVYHKIVKRYRLNHLKAYLFNRNIQN